MATFLLRTTLPAQGKHVSNKKETEMNLTTIANIPSSNFKRIKGQYIAAAAGMALVTSGLLGAAPWQQNNTPVTNVNVVSHNAARAVPMQVYHIVATEAERDMLATEFGGNYVVKGSDREALLYGDQSAAMTQAGVDFRIIDTTKPNFGVPTSTAQPTNLDINASVRSTEDAVYGIPVLQGKASDTDIAASVLSTERANYVAPVSASRASDADIAASVLSAEMAAYDFTATRPAKRQALEADIMASVVSTEKAAGY
jgi:hypothetical protein